MDHRCGTLLSLCRQWHHTWTMPAAQGTPEEGTYVALVSSLRGATRYLKETQIQEDVSLRVRFFRHISKGGWPFSTKAHGWPITDCTAEGLKATLSIMRTDLLAPTERLSDSCLADACNMILSWQNKDGGWATYELQRAGAWLELLNPSEVFGDIMVDYSYVECTSACLQALLSFGSHYPSHRTAEVQQAMQRGAQFIKQLQRQDGSWYGSWAVCFTYGTWFGVKGLLAAGEQPGCSEALARAASFLLVHQNPDGGWGESVVSCSEKCYVRIESQVVQTGWAVLTLLAAAPHDAATLQAAARGVQLLLQRQQADGSWPQERISGVFNKTSGITYINYRNIFPLWALGEYTKLTTACTSLQSQSNE